MLLSSLLTQSLQITSGFEINEAFRKNTNMFFEAQEKKIGGRGFVLSILLCRLQFFCVFELYIFISVDPSKNLDKKLYCLDTLLSNSLGVTMSRK